MSAATVVNVRNRTINLVSQALKTMGKEEDEPQTGIIRSLIWNIEQKEKVVTTPNQKCQFVQHAVEVNRVPFFSPAVEQNETAGYFMNIENLEEKMNECRRINRWILQYDEDCQSTFDDSDKDKTYTPSSNTDDSSEEETIENKSKRCHISKNSSRSPNKESHSPVVSFSVENPKNVLDNCNICNSNEENDDIHRHSFQHRMNYMLDCFQKNKSSFRGNRYGVELTIDIKQINGYKYDFTTESGNKGTYYLNITPSAFRSHGNQIEFTCQIKNCRTTRQDPIVITYAGVLHPFEPYSMIDTNSNIDHGKFVEIKAGDTYSVIVRLKLEGNHVSNFKIPIYFSIQTINKSKENMEDFSIFRSIVVAIHEQILEDAIIEKSPFTQNRWEKVKTIPPKHQNYTSLDQFPIPRNFWKTMLTGLTKDYGDGALHEILQKLEPGYVTLQNYKDFFHILLWLEEMCCVLGLSSYNMENVHLYVRGNDLELVVPGLAEKRPSVIKGDLIEIKVHNDHTSYQGIIQRVGDRTVIIGSLDDNIIDMVKQCPKIEIDVRFKLGRIHFERMHQGVEQVVLNGFVKQLFPSERLLSNNISEPICLSQNDLYDRNIYTNREQMTAVHKILNNTSKGAPYIINGPPGTGKTVTIVEAIYHLKKGTKQKILVCAPANAACNMLTEKLAAFCTTDDLKRVMSENCDTASINPSIVKFCNVIKDEDNYHVVVPFLKENLTKYRIIVTTLVFAGKYTREYHPDIVFLDEAAQAREPEACCAIGLLTKTKRVVLAGDPQQLGPVVHSDICKKYKYDISLLERLLALDLYQNDTQNNFTTMLKLNFRSHEEVLRLPNQLFYNNSLRAVSAAAKSDPLAKTNIHKLIQNGGTLNQSGSAIEFCSVLALEKREGRSPSYYNPREVLMVQKYIKVLTSLKFPQPEMNVTPSQIGVVTPYIRQMYKIREALANFRDVEIGTTEAFQGREKRVMIISTVRAQEDLLLHDKMYKLGFVREPKRFNVAITRAKSKVIVIGNPLVLKTDEKWLRFIEQARQSGTLCGAPFPKRNQQEAEELSRRLKKNFYLKDVKHNR